MISSRGGFREAAAIVTAAALLFSGLKAAPLAAAAAVSPVDISHDPLKCVNTDYAPKVDAAVAPGKDLDKGYVYFKAAGTEDFYYAVMKGAPENLEGVLPRPMPETRAIDYKIRATDVRELAREVGEFTPPVVPGNACKVRGAPAGVPVGKEGAGLTIGLTREGQNPVPPGFNRRDIAFVILFGGATVTLAAALKPGGTSSAASGGSAGSGSAGAAAGGAAKSGTGMSTGLAVGLGAVAVAGGAIAIANNNKSSKAASTVTPTATATATRTFTPTPTSTAVPARFIDAAITWSGTGNIDVEIRNPSNQVVGTNLPAGCESTASRTEHVLLQGVLPAGTYRVMLTASNCGSATAPASIATAVTVQSESGPKCNNAFVSVPVGTTVQGCQFTLP
ncbi:MAG: hypothetical protein LC796_08830 [Acidobacteria bacterium]|nr:hypothetical protein [Acidobacteriota bacterium]MCA1610132.1 hypothetical protein [Acidobacteriota bacterium]